MSVCKKKTHPARIRWGGGREEGKGLNIACFVVWVSRTLTVPLYRLSDAFSIARPAGNINLYCLGAVPTTTRVLSPQPQGSELDSSQQQSQDATSLVALCPYYLLTGRATQNCLERWQHAPLFKGGDGNTPTPNHCVSGPTLLCMSLCRA